MNSHQAEMSNWMELQKFGMFDFTFGDFAAHPEKINKSIIKYKYLMPKTKDDYIFKLENHFVRMHLFL